MSDIVSDDDVEKALDYLRDQARPAAKAMAESAYMLEYRKFLKAKLMGKCNEKHSTDKERHAYAHPDYEAHLKAMQTAIEKAKESQFLLEAASIKIDVWKAEQYRNRKLESI